MSLRPAWATGQDTISKHKTLKGKTKLQLNLCLPSPQLAKKKKKKALHLGRHYGPSHNQVPVDSLIT